MMRNAGIEVVEALKVNVFRMFLRRMDLRQHRKIVLIDNYVAYTGSMNMVDPRFFKQDAGVGQWIDMMARMEGPVATTLGIVYACDWEIETGKRILPRPRREYYAIRRRDWSYDSSHRFWPWFPRRNDPPGIINSCVCRT